jgi:hypothetical protein
MNNSSRISISAFGVIVAIAGIEHGIGEILQGNHAPGGVFISSWPYSPFFEILTGEPAMTIVPNLLVTGILAILTTISFLLWSTLLLCRENAGIAMILSSIGMLLAGGGMCPPIIGIILGIATLITSTPLHYRRGYQPGENQCALARAWPVMLILSLVIWLWVFPSLPVLGYYYGLTNPYVVVVLSFSALITLLLTLYFARVKDTVAGCESVE